MKEKNVLRSRRSYTHTHLNYSVLGKHAKRDTRLKPPPGGPAERGPGGKPWGAMALEVPVATRALGLSRAWAAALCTVSTSDPPRSINRLAWRGS